MENSVWTRVWPAAPKVRRSDSLWARETRASAKDSTSLRPTRRPPVCRNWSIPAPAGGGAFLLGGKFHRLLRDGFVDCAGSGGLRRPANFQASLRLDQLRNRRGQRLF